MKKLLNKIDNIKNDLLRSFAYAGCVVIISIFVLCVIGILAFICYLLDCAAVTIGEIVVVLATVLFALIGMTILFYLFSRMYK